MLPCPRLLLLMLLTLVLLLLLLRKMLLAASVGELLHRVAAAETREKMTKKMPPGLHRGHRVYSLGRRY